MTQLRLLLAALGAVSIGYSLAKSGHSLLFAFAMVAAVCAASFLLENLLQKRKHRLDTVTPEHPWVKPRK